MSHIFDSTIGLLSNGLDITLQRQKVLTSNLANLDTPNFIPQDVDFSAALKTAMTNDAAGLSNATTRTPTIERADKTPGINGNAVDLDVQMSRLAHNTTLYGSMTQVISRKLAMMRYAIQEGGS